MAATLYTPLEDWQMRVLELDMGTFGQSLVGSLHIVDILDFDGVLIASQRRRITYHALSYSWGASVFDQHITCNSVKLSITSNVHAALQRIRHVDQHSFFWIDSICIDQSDIRERSKQVSMMLKIFSKAESVIVWLGEDYVAAEDDIDRYANAVSAPLLPQRPLLRTLSGRPWFERVWVRQEVWAAARTVVRWHDRSVPWEHCFGRYEEVLGIRRASRMERFRATMGDEPRDILSDMPSALDIVSVLRRCAGSRCTDPRDHVYGVLGMSDTKTSITASQQPSVICLTVDYSRHAAEVLQDVAEYIIRRDRNLAFLYLHPSPGSKVKALDRVIPSWVPDWRRRHSSLISDWRRRSHRVFLLPSPTRWTCSHVPGGLRVSAWHLGTIAHTRDPSSVVARLDLFPDDALASLEAFCTHRGLVRVSIGSRSQLWLYDTGVRLETQVLHPINYLLATADQQSAKTNASPHRDRTRNPGTDDRLCIDFAWFSDLMGDRCQVRIPFNDMTFDRLDHTPEWQQLDTFPSSLIQTQQARTTASVGLAKLQGSAVWDRLGLILPAFILPNGYFNHPPDLWFPCKWRVPMCAKPGDQILAVRGGCLPIVVRPLPDSHSVTYVGPADLDVGMEHYTLGRNIHEGSDLREYRGQTFVDTYMGADERSARVAMLHFFFDFISAVMQTDTSDSGIFEELDIV